ncbi:MAG: hypothetical protein K5662_04665 [Lachnospiraceae bacterium]|nr:hypothetical protein [Lachnospiraceae bacterium]
MGKREDHKRNLLRLGKPFSFEEAMKIIEDGAGKQFDPVIARVFIENADRVKEIAEEHKRTIG